MKLKAGRFLLLVASGAVASIASLAALVAACGGDNAGTDVQDAGPIKDGTVLDSSQEQPDAGGMDAQGADALPTTDGGPDAGESVDGSDASPGVDVQAPNLADFAHAVDVAYCHRLNECCVIEPGQTWAQDHCVTVFDGFGGAYGQAAFKSELDGGSIAYDPSAATACIAGVEASNCGAISAMTFGSLIDLCFSATKGTLGLDAGACIDSLQCSPGEYCASTDGGLGTCVALRSAGQPCTDTRNSSQCSYRGSGSLVLYCGQSDAGTTCLPTEPLTSPCKSNGQCQTRICDSTGAGCINSYSFSDNGLPFGFCATFTVDGGIADAGDAAPE